VFSLAFLTNSSLFLPRHFIVTLEIVLIKLTTMRSAIANGLRNSTLFYVLSIAAAVVVHAMLGWENKSFIPKSAIVMIFVCLIALPWALLNVSNLIYPVKRFRNAGELIAHVIFLGVIVIFLNFARWR
jgi:hypothetical protein